jgi:hypothetical protein
VSSFSLVFGPWLDSPHSNAKFAISDCYSQSSQICRRQKSRYSLLDGFNDSHQPCRFSSVRWCPSYLCNCSSCKMVLTRCVNVKLPPSSNGYVPARCLMTAIVVVLCTGSRCDLIHQKYERVIYKFGIQVFLSCLFEVASKT